MPILAASCSSQNTQHGAACTIISHRGQHSAVLAAKSNTHLVASSSSTACCFPADFLLGLPLQHIQDCATWLPAAGAPPPAACFDTEVKAPLMASVLEQFNRVTQMARERTSNLLASAAYLSPGPGV